MKLLLGALVCLLWVYLQAWVLTLFHEAAHARVAQRLSLQPVAIRVGRSARLVRWRPIYLLCRLDPEQTEIYIGNAPRGDGHTGCAQTADRKNLKKLYWAGIRADAARPVVVAVPTYLLLEVTDSIHRLPYNAILAVTVGWILFAGVCFFSAFANFIPIVLKPVTSPVRRSDGKALRLLYGKAEFELLWLSALSLRDVAPKLRHIEKGDMTSLSVAKRLRR